MTAPFSAIAIIPARLASTRLPRKVLREIAEQQLVHFADRFGLVEGLDDLLAHITAIHMFMPDTRMTGTGEILHCQGTVLAEWSATGSDGRPKGAGKNVFVPYTITKGSNWGQNSSQYSGVGGPRVVQLGAKLYF